MFNQVNNNLENVKNLISTAKNKKIAVVSDQLSGGIGGAESVLFALYDLYPHLKAFTTVLNKDILPEKYKNMEITPSFIQKMPFAKTKYKNYLPLMPMAIESIDLQEFDLIFSSHHCVAKGAIPRPDATHVCYCHSPARYMWDLQWTYSSLAKFNTLQKAFIHTASHYFRMWDASSADRVDLFIANSKYTAARIKKYYGKDSILLYPPVNTDHFKYESTQDYYLMVGRLVAYKGYELAIEAFNESGRKLIIVGDGEEYKRLKKKAGKNILMPGKVSELELIQYMNNCKGFIFPGKEDFGIVMVEAQAAGKPVIAFNQGGALDIVKDGENGILFDEQNIYSLNKAVNQSEKTNWDHKEITRNAKRFDRYHFYSYLSYITENIEEIRKSMQN